MLKIILSQFNKKRKIISYFPVELVARKGRGFVWAGVEAGRVGDFPAAADAQPHGVSTVTYKGFLRITRQTWALGN